MIQDADQSGPIPGTLPLRQSQRNSRGCFVLYRMQGLDEDTYGLNSYIWIYIYICALDKSKSILLKGPPDVYGFYSDDMPSQKQRRNCEALLCLSDVGVSQDSGVPFETLKVYRVWGLGL